MKNFHKNNREPSRSFFYQLRFIILFIIPVGLFIIFRELFPFLRPFNENYSFRVFQPPQIVVMGGVTVPPPGGVEKGRHTHVSGLQGSLSGNPVYGTRAFTGDTVRLKPPQPKVAVLSYHTRRSVVPVESVDTRTRRIATEIFEANHAAMIGEANQRLFNPIPAQHIIGNVPNPNGHVNAIDWLSPIGAEIINFNRNKCLGLEVMNDRAWIDDLRQRFPILVATQQHGDIYLNSLYASVLWDSPVRLEYPARPGPSERMFMSSYDKPVLVNNAYYDNFLSLEYKGRTAWHHTNTESDLIRGREQFCYVTADQSMVYLLPMGGKTHCVTHWFLAAQTGDDLHIRAARLACSGVNRGYFC